MSVYYLCQEIKKPLEFSKITSDSNLRESSIGYNLITSFEHSQQCKAFGFNNSNSIWVLAYGVEILVCQMDNQTMRVEQSLQGHKSCVNNILYSNKEDMFFSIGSWNDNVIVWTRDSDRKWNKQFLIYKEQQTRDFEVVQLILNNDENELIGVMDYNFIVVWQRTSENKWINKQVISISQNEHSQILQVSYDKNCMKIIIINQSGQVQFLAKNQQNQWKKRQLINLKGIKGKKYYNIDNDQLVIQTQKMEYLLFNFNTENELYEEGQVNMTQCLQSMLNQVFEYNSSISQSQDVVGLKRNEDLLIFTKDTKNLYQQIQTIQFEHSFFYQFSKNNQYLITWDYSKFIKIWKQNND
ncbi:unnamed protein product [Paramecium pentaurelia]|uniref:WD40-repeat-containing domain n=1 Tax=Paramecium pentaurelia TaxID=43138 RepID=A0A8S1T7C1_9CILI|nr:unnamed protein product [Paramecium pentaurelia]